MKGFLQLQSINRFTRYGLSALVVLLLIQNNSIAQSPGGISSNLYLWLKSNAGVTQTSNQVTAWANQASTSMTTQASTAGSGVTASNNILYANNTINYNPAIVFNGTANYCLQGTFSSTPTNPPLMFAVAIGGSGSGDQQYACVYSNSNTAGGSTGMIYDAVHGEYWADFNGATCANTPAEYNVPSLVRLYYNNTTKANGAYIALNGIQQATNACTNSDKLTAAQGSFQIGGRTWQGYTSRIFLGSMAEVIYYNANSLTAAQINQVESYLALKYGITLGSTSSLVNYTSSTGTTFWTGNASYQNDVFGIGTDNGSGLTQTQSNSMNNGSGSGVGQSGRGNLILTAPSALTNQQFLMVGDDAGALTEQTTNVPATIIGSKRITRTWLAQNTGTVGTVNLSFDMTGLTLTGGSTASNYRLMVNNTASSSDFTTGTQTYYTPTSISGNLINFTGVSLPNNAVFTLVTNYVLSSTSPGGVSSNLYLWLNAGNGVTQTSGQVTNWMNLAPITMTTQASTADANIAASANILYAADSINFNPSIVYNGTSSYCLQGRYAIAPTNAPTIFAVAIGRTGGSAYGDTYASSVAGSFGMGWGGSSVSGYINLGAYNIDGSGIDCSSTPVATNQAAVVRAYYSNSLNTSGAYTALNGIATSTTCSSNAINSGATDTAFQIGGRTWGGNPSRIFQGNLSELIYYNSNTLTAAQINQVETYLALKYGVTLGSTSSLVNYTSSAGTTFWTGNATYQNDVFGIGTDNGSGLTQTQSNSMNNGSGSGIGQSGKGNLILTAPSALTNQQFIMVGDDEGALAEETTNLPAGTTGSKRVVRNWLVQNTGSVGPVNLSFDMTGLTLSGGTTAANYRLLVNSNTDATFATGTATHYYPSSINGNLINFTGVNLPNNTVFTLVTFANGVTLPAIWLSFTATKQGSGALLNWTTADEVNVGYYEVEQSANGSSYTTVGKVQANNAVTNNYSFKVNNLLDGPNYFRIGRVDLDGNIVYSDVRIINNGESYAVTITPNPIAGSQLQMKIVASQSQQTSVLIMGMDGRLLQNKIFTVQEGANMEEIDLGRIATGAYIARIMIGNTIISQKFIKE